ncbi:Pycsar system effector family protein [Tepidicaulis sp.]|uniref:Pycsar system effector family protein n=1 Tax=Tepidicaulis sp. TaxID=1920809 RepID=UPI003B5A817A
MEDDHIFDRAEKNLERMLNWGVRHDARSSVLLGITAAMAGGLGAILPNIACWSLWAFFLVGSSYACIIYSVVHLALSQFPRTNSPNSSLLYFGTISKRNIREFERLLREQTQDEYLHDLSCQIHENAVLLDKKFSHTKHAMISLFVSLPFWTLSIMLLSSL